MKGNGKENQTLAICFGQFGPYHHARVAALQRLVWEMGDGSSAENRKLNTGDCSHAWRVLPVQIAAATSTYAWEDVQGTAGLKDQEPSLGDGSRQSRGQTKRPEEQATNAVAAPPLAEGLRTLCEGTDEAASPLGVFLKARKLFCAEGVGVAFLPSYSPARFFALFAAAKSLGIRTVMMNESHAGTEQATGWKRWIKRQIVKRFDAAFVGGEPHKRHFASLGIPSDKIFTGYDAVDNDFFASRADDIRAAAKKSVQFSVGSVQQEKAAGEVRSMERGARRVEQDESSKDQEPESAGVDGDSARRSQGQTKRRSVREAYGLPERYFLSLGRMVEKKNLATLVAAYAKFCDGWRVASDESARRAPVSLVFVGSGELEGALREQASGLGLRVVDRTDWKAGQSSHSRVFETAEGKFTRIDADKSERLAADRTKGNAASSVTRAGCGLSPETTSGDDAAVMKARDSLPATSHGENFGTVFFYGFRQIEENPVFYALAEAFVLPSLKEEWGLVVNEAMACSLPVIVSRTTGCAEDLLPGSGSMEHGAWSMESGLGADTENCRLKTENSLEQRSNGFVFDPSSVEALSEALRRIAGQKTNSRVFEPQMAPRQTARGRAEGKPTDQETNGLTEMGRRSREIVAKFSCENFARQALRAAEAAGP